jgi:hypothetical protein
MKIKLFHDNTLELDIKSISKNITRLASNITVLTGNSSFRIKNSFISAPDTYIDLPSKLINESAGVDIAIIFTDIPYDNNYFWQGEGNICIVSLWGWDSLTSIPRNNGVVFFICAIVMQYYNIGFRHDEKTGCVNDFWMNKTDVDLGMRTGSVCQPCLTHFQKKGNKTYNKYLDQVQLILHEISLSSRTELDICDYWNMRNAKELFDVFLCHNSQDKEAVRNMNVELQKEGIKTWFDEEQLPPGRLWQELLEEQITQIKTATIFVGQSGLGPWQDVELRAFISEFVRRRCPVIPVILSQCKIVPQLPLFLREFTWVDFRKSVPDPFSQLLWGITGERRRGK